jgi:hypothetical protein
MLRPFLIIGVGGSGGKTVRAIRQALRFRLEQENWGKGIPQGWQFLHVDSPTAQDGIEFPAPLMAQEDYLALVPNGVTYATIHDDVVERVEPAFARDVRRSLPSPNEVKVPVYLGAGAYRAVGRTISAAALDDIHDRVKAKVSLMQSPTANSELQELSKNMGIQISGAVSPTVIVVSSVAGGSGAGMFMDVAEAAKAAIGPLPWVHQVFSMLFAPDVFEELGPDKMRAMAPNALGAIAELVSGNYRRNPTDATLALYRRYGLTVPSDTTYNLGPNFNYVIGRKNGNAKAVDFGSQQGVYLAAAQSIAAWMMDQKVQDSLSAYAVTNFGANSAGVRDATGLKRAKLDGQPLSSLGFARVTLGLDKFSEYAAERMAKQTLMTMLNQHMSQDPELKEKKEDQWIEHHVDLYEGAFISQSGLDELTEVNNQVVDALTPNWGEIIAKLTANINFSAGQGMPKGGHSFQGWVTRITQAFDVAIQPALSEAELLIQAKAKDWVSSMPERVLELVRKTIAQHGLPVTIQLLDRLIERSKRASLELLEERSRHLSDATKTSLTVSEKLGPVQQMANIPASHPAVSEAVSGATWGFGYKGFAEVKRVSSDLISDFTENFLVPLKTNLSRSYGALREKTEDPKLVDGRQNPYKYWPDFKSKSVDQRFEPAPNERMLIQPKFFPKIFDQLVEQTVNDPQVQASKRVMSEMLGGSRLLEGVSELSESQSWIILDLVDNQMWVPKETKYRLREQSNQPANFKLEPNHMEYVDFAKRWLRVPGRSFSAFLGQSITSYLNASGDTQENSKRSSEFVAAVTAAIQSSDPLVSLDATLMSLTHEEMGKSAICSGIPVDESDPLYDAIKDSIITNGYEPSDVKKWFVSSAKGSKMSSIEIFTQLKTPVNPLVMGSLLGPIASEWISASGNFASRSNFMNWRRGRELPEAIPAHQERWSAMLRGWHIARLLNLFENDTKHASYTDKGPKVSIWTDPSKGWKMFPYPLHSSHIAKNVDDYPAIILESLIIALANCYSSHSLEPLDPYSRLMELGGGNQDQWPDLENWILSGSTQQGAPTPRPERSGSSTDAPDSRKEISIAYVTEMSDKFEARMAALDPHVDPRTYPIVWEIRDEMRSSFAEVLSAIRNVEASEDL